MKKIANKSLTYGAHGIVVWICCHHCTIRLLCLLLSFQSQQCQLVDLWLLVSVLRVGGSFAVWQSLVVSLLCSQEDNLREIRRCNRLHTWVQPCGLWVVTSSFHSISWRACPTRTTLELRIWLDFRDLYHDPCRFAKLCRLESLSASVRRGAFMWPFVRGLQRYVATLWSRWQWLPRHGWAPCSSARLDGASMWAPEFVRWALQNTTLLAFCCFGGKPE